MHSLTTKFGEEVMVTDQVNVTLNPQA